MKHAWNTDEGVRGREMEHKRLYQRFLPHHPEGIQSLSPGLRGTSYPGCAMGWGVNPERIPPSQNSRIEPRNPGFFRKSLHGNGLGDVPFRGFLGRVVSSVPFRAARLTCTVCRMRVIQPLQGWRFLSARSPRVARASQPWAERCNPFGIAASSVSRMSSAPGMRTSLASAALYGERAPAPP